MNFLGHEIFDHKPDPAKPSYLNPVDPSQFPTESVVINAERASEAVVPETIGEQAVASVVEAAPVEVVSMENPTTEAGVVTELPLVTPTEVAAEVPVAPEQQNPAA